MELTEQEWEELARMALGVLTERGPLTAQEVAALLIAQGVELGEDPADMVEEALFDEPRAFYLPDERIADLEPLLDGLTLTYRLNEDEAADEAVVVEADLAPLLLTDQDEFPLATGGEASLESPDQLDPFAEDMVLAGPPGWLGGAVGGDLLAFRWADGHLHVERVRGELADCTEAAKRLVAAFAASAEDDSVVASYNVVATALADAPGLLSHPLAPLSEVFEAAGLEVSGEWVGTIGQDWSQRENLFEEAWRQALGLDEPEVRALWALPELFTRFVDAEPEERATFQEELASVGPILDVDEVAEAFLATTLEQDPALEPDIVDFAHAVVEAGPQAAGAHYVLSRCAEHRNDLAAAEAHLAAALASDPDFLPALLDAAWYAEDRGDAKNALGYLRQAGTDPREARVVRLQHFAAPRPAAVGRNRPCPCGSGRKYKMCCAQRTDYPLPERAGWLHCKAVLFMLRPAQRDIIREVALARTGVDPDDEAWVDTALADPLTHDLTLFDAGVFESFLDARGPLLPADELALGRPWIGIRRSLHEVVVVRPDGSMQLRDVRTGAQLDVTEPVDAVLRAGTLLWGRAVPNGRGHQLLDGVAVIAPTLRDRILAFLDTETSAEETAAWFSAVEAETEPHSSPGVLKGLLSFAARRRKPAVT
jgi:hypothetical protein